MSKLRTPPQSQGTVSVLPIQTIARWFLMLTLVTGLWSVSQSHAAILSWSGGSGSSANWNDSANWGFAGTPANGDTLIFSAAQPRLANTNNIPGLVLNQIRFVGA